MTTWRCSRPDGKPDICANWPLTAGTLEPYADVCGFRFDSGGVRHGECNRCGECCKAVWIKFPEFSEKLRGARCPYLVEDD